MWRVFEALACRCGPHTSARATRPFTIKHNKRKRLWLIYLCIIVWRPVSVIIGLRLIHIRLAGSVAHRIAGGRFVRLTRHKVVGLRLWLVHGRWRVISAGIVAVDGGVLRLANLFAAILVRRVLILQIQALELLIQLAKLLVDASLVLVALADARVDRRCRKVLIRVDRHQGHATGCVQRGRCLIGGIKTGQTGLSNHEERPKSLVVLTGYCSKRFNRLCCH